MARRSLISVVNHVAANGTALTAGGGGITHSGSLSPQNVANPSPQIIWRSTSASSAGITRYVDADFGADVEIGAVGAAWWRSGIIPAVTDTVQVQLDPDGGSPGAGALLDVNVASTINPYIANFCHTLAAPVSARYLRLTQTLATRTYAELGLLWAGPIIQPAINVVYPMERLWGDWGRVSVSPRSGIIRADRRPRPREVGFQFAALSDDEADEMLDAQRVAGRTGQVLFCSNPDSPAKATIFGRVADLSPSAHESFPLHRQAFRIIEDL